MRVIDADALKETIAKNVYVLSDAFNSRDYGMFWTGGIEKAIDEQPTAQQWIPCSERLPEPDKAVLAYAPKYNNIWAVTITDSGKWLMWTTGILYEYNQDFNGELVAWMPLPDPYEEKR